MGIKRRPTIDPATEAAIEAFGEAAERPTEAPIAQASPQPARPARKKVPTPPATPATEWPDDVAKTLLIRYPDLELPALLTDVARAVEIAASSATIR